MRIQTLNKESIQEYGRYLLNEYRDACYTFEAAAQALCENIYDEFCKEQNEPEFALVRIFRTVQYKELNTELKQKSKTFQPQLALMGTMGLEHDWQSRQQSQNRQLIQLGENTSPMFQGVFSELGFQMKDFYSDEAPSGQPVHSMVMLRYFHVEDASKTHAITDQEEFVKPYGIKSAFAIGSQFLSHQAYVLIGFSHSPISQEQAEILAELAPHVSTLLAIFDRRKALWS